MSSHYFDLRIQKARRFLAQRMPASSTEHPKLTKAYWDLLRKIKTDRSAALQLAYQILDNPNPAERFLGISLLGSIFNPTERHQHTEARQMIKRLSTMAEHEEHPAVLTQIAYALGKPYLREALPALVKLSHHAHEDVRYAAVGSFSSAIHEKAPAYALKRLLELTADHDADVRNWATFELGIQLDPEFNDTPAVREALFARTRDRHHETRAEAFRGLARYGDDRGRQPLYDWLSRQDQQDQPIWRWELEAAGYYGDPRFFDILADIATWWGDKNRDTLEWALARCNPDPLIRAKTTREPDMMYADFDWRLDSNGVSVIYENGDQIIDLHNECQFTEMYTNYNELVLIFRKTAEYTKPSYLSVGEEIALVIAGAQVKDLPKLDYPCNFEGIYDLTSESFALCIEDACYPIRGKNITLKFQSR